MEVKRFPKVKSPFKRQEDENGDYVVYDEINDGFEWVFENDDVIAVEKLDGTNCAVKIEHVPDDHNNIEAWTRHGYEPFQKAEPYGQTPHQYIVRAMQNSLRRGYLDNLQDGVHYGESVGPDFQGNPHELDENLFIPFSWLKDKCSYNSWGKYPKNFDTIKGWFEDDLFSLFASRMHGMSLDDASVKNGTFVEGLMFLHPDACYQQCDLTFEEEMLSGGRYRKICPNIAKLRRDMFSGWQSGDWPMQEFGH